MSLYGIKRKKHLQIVRAPLALAMVMMLATGCATKNSNSTATATHSASKSTELVQDQPIRPSSNSGSNGFLKSFIRGGSPADTDSITTGSIGNPKGSQEKGYFRKSGKLSLTDVVSLTLNTNPEVDIAKAQELDAEIGIEIEKAAYHPQVDLTATIGPEHVYSESASSYVTDRGEVNLLVEQKLYDFGKTKNAVERRRLLHESATLRKSDTREKIALEVMTAYLGYLRQSDLTASSARNVRAHQRMENLVRMNAEGGNGTAADVKRIETRLDAAQNDKLQNDDRLEDSIAAFKRLTEMDPSRVLRPRRLAAVTLNNEYSIEAMVYNNPRLLSTAADQRSLEKQLAHQKATLYPEFFAQSEMTYKHNVSGETGEGSEVKGLVGMRFRLYDGGKRRRLIDQINARIREANARHRKTYRELVQEAEQNRQALRTSREKTGFLSDSVQAARKVINVYEDQFKAGKRTPFEMLDAQRDLYRAEQDAINHRYDTAITKYKNLRIQGKLADHLANGKL